MSQATEKLRTIFNELTTGEDVNPEVRSKIALGLDALMDVEVEVADAEDSKRIANQEKDELAEENRRLRVYNSQLTMKLGTAVAQAEENEPDEPEVPEEENDELDDIIDNYEMR